MGTINNILTKTFAIIVLSILVFSCTSEVTQAPPVAEENNIELTSIHDLNLLVPDIENALPADAIANYKNGKDYTLSSEKEAKLKKILAPLTKVGSDLLDASNIENDKLRSEYDDLKESELVVLGLMILIEKEINDSPTKGKGASDLDAEALFKCGAAAIGLADIKELFSVKGLEKAVKSGKALKIIGKVAARQAGILGAAYTTYELVTCINGEI